MLFVTKRHQKMSYVKLILRVGFTINLKMLVSKLVTAAVHKKALRQKKHVNLVNANNYIFK